MCKVVEVTDGHLGVAGCGTHKCRPTATEHFQKTVRDLPFCNILYTSKVPNWLVDIFKISRICVKQTRCVAVALHAVRSRAVLFGLPCSWRNGIINFWYFRTAKNSSVLQRTFATSVNRGLQQQPNGIQPVSGHNIFPWVTKELNIPQSKSCMWASRIWASLAQLSGYVMSIPSNWLYLG